MRQNYSIKISKAKAQFPAFPNIKLNTSLKVTRTLVSYNGFIDDLL